MKNIIKLALSSILITVAVTGCKTKKHSSSTISSSSEIITTSTFDSSSNSSTNSSSSSLSNNSSNSSSSRDSTSTSLSTDVQTYYKDADGLSGYALKTKLSEIISRNFFSRDYDSLRIDWFKLTDKKPNGEIWDMYSDVPDGTPAYTYTFGQKICGNYKVEGDCWNSEHSVPQSWFKEAKPMVSDIFHLYPTDGKVNGIRSNYPFGEVDTVKTISTNKSKLGTGTSESGYTGTVFEPIDEYKGDFARGYFYMATRYENQIKNWSSPMFNNTSNQAFTNWAKNLLIKWHEQDPVSQKEIDRNQIIYKEIQYNRNPFIDHPEYVDMIWK